MPLPSFRLRSLLVAVAVIALLLGAWHHIQGRIVFHSHAARWHADKARFTIMGKTAPGHDQDRAMMRRISWHEQMAVWHRRMAEAPWLLIAPGEQPPAL